MSSSSSSPGTVVPLASQSPEEAPHLVPISMQTGTSSPSSKQLLLKVTFNFGLLLSSSIFLAGLIQAYLDTRNFNPLIVGYGFAVIWFGTRGVQSWRRWRGEVRKAMKGEMEKKVELEQLAKDNLSYVRTSR
ncbi:hypothetical protein BDY24DRAFT_392371 [Mrakia frigida]|uniref:uncharacterized protein n=1 Tax=Mrakia frigida TaxID=29902 RepID=UPI003FCBFBB4